MDTFWEHFLIFYYPIFGGISLILNSLLIFLMLKKSPPFLVNIRPLFLNTTITQWIITVVTTASQIRIIPIESVLGWICLGPLSRLSLSVCYAVYHLFNSCEFHLGLSVFLTIFYRYKVLKSSGKIINSVKYIIFSLLISTFTLIIPFFAATNFAEVRLKLKGSYPSYNLDRHSSIVGFSDTSDMIYQLNTFILLLVAFGLPFSVLFMRWKIKKLLDSERNSVSTRTRQLSQSLVTIITVQAVMPTVCYLPVLSSFLLHTRIHSNFLIPLEYLQMIIIALPSLLDPLITLYFMTPYRNAFLQLFCCCIRNSKSPSSTEIVSGAHVTPF